MNCTSIQADLIAAVTGDDDAAVRQNVDRHLDGCAACRATASRYRRLLDAITPEVVFPREGEVDWSVPLTCTLVRRDLAVTPDTADETVTAHLARCAACAAEATALRRVLAAITPAIVFPREEEVDWSIPLTCSRVREELSSVLDAQAPAWDMVLAHLARCPACAENAATIGETLAMARRARPEEAQVDWDRFAAETASLARAEAPAAAPGGRRAWRRTARLLLPVAASLIAAFGLAWLSLRPPGTSAPPIAGRTPPAGVADATPADAGPEAEALLDRTRVEMARSHAARYLADSGTLLVGLSDLAMRCGKDQVDISLEQALSTRLLRRKQFLEQDLQDVEVARAMRLADEIEDLLVDIAGLQPCTPPQRVQAIDDVVRQRQLLMRIEMISNELASGGARA